MEVGGGTAARRPSVNASSFLQVAVIDSHNLKVPPRKTSLPEEGRSPDTQHAWLGTAQRPLSPCGRSPPLGLALGRPPLCHPGPGHGLSGRCHLPLPGKPGRARRRQPLSAMPSTSHPTDLLLARAWGKVGDQGRRLPLCQLWGRRRRAPKACRKTSQLTRQVPVGQVLSRSLL